MSLGKPSVQKHNQVVDIVRGGGGGGQGVPRLKLVDELFNTFDHLYIKPIKRFISIIVHSLTL